MSFFSCLNWWIETCPTPGGLGVIFKILFKTGEMTAERNAMYVNGKKRESSAVLFGKSTNMHSVTMNSWTSIPESYFPPNFPQTPCSYISSLSWFDTQGAGHWSLSALVLYKWYHPLRTLEPDPEYPEQRCNRHLKSLCKSSCFFLKSHTLNSPGLSHLSLEINICAVKHLVCVIIVGRDFPGLRC